LGGDDGFDLRRSACTWGVLRGLWSSRSLGILLSWRMPLCRPNCCRRSLRGRCHARQEGMLLALADEDISPDVQSPRQYAGTRQAATLAPFKHGLAPVQLGQESRGQSEKQVGHLFSAFRSPCHSVPFHAIADIKHIL